MKCPLGQTSQGWQRPNRGHTSDPLLQITSRNFLPSSLLPHFALRAPVGGQQVSELELAERQIATATQSVNERVLCPWLGNSHSSAVQFLIHSPQDMEVQSHNCDACATALKGPNFSASVSFPIPLQKLQVVI